MDRNRIQIIENTASFVKESLKDAEAGHDWHHANRVKNTALKIAENESADLLIVILGALLHDIGDSKFYQGNENIGPKRAKEFLKTQNLDSDIIEHVIKIIENISFKGGNFKQNFYSLELDIVQDADRLDAIGAIGIARAFAYGGFKNRKLYDPEIKPSLNMTKEEYKKNTGPTINHFYEKLLLLKNKMNTQTGRKLAEKRDDFMKIFLDEFYKEWNGIL